MRSISVPPKYQGVYDRAMSGRSLKASIRAHCLYCMYWDSAEVRACTAPWCPLFPHRLGYGPKDQAVKEPDLCESPCEKFTGD